jgi:Flp pilus assembly protein TadD
MLMMNRNGLFASLALVFAAACGGAAQDTSSDRSVAVARQETQSSGAQKSEKSEGMCEHHKMDPAMADAKAAIEKKDWDGAIAKLSAITESQPDNAKAAMLHGYALHAAGRLDEALVMHQKAAGFADMKAVALYNIACVHALKGDKEKAFAALDESVKAGFGKAEYFETDTDLASLRSDARFAGMVQAAKANPQTAKKEHTCDHEKSGKKANKTW